MTEIIDLDAYRPRTAPDLTKHTAPSDTAPPREVLEGVVIPSGTPGRGKSAAPSGARWPRTAAACRGCDAARHHP